MAQIDGNKSEFHLVGLVLFRQNLFGGSHEFIVQRRHNDIDSLFGKFFCDCKSNSTGSAFRGRRDELD